MSIVHQSFGVHCPLSISHLLSNFLFHSLLTFLILTSCKTDKPNGPKLGIQIYTNEVDPPWGGSITGSKRRNICKSCEKTAKEIVKYLLFNIIDLYLQRSQCLWGPSPGVQNLRSAAMCKIKIRMEIGNINGMNHHFDS